MYPAVDRWSLWADENAYLHGFYLKSLEIGVSMMNDFNSQRNGLLNQSERCRIENYRPPVALKCHDIRNELDLLIGAIET